MLSADGSSNAATPSSASRRSLATYPSSVSNGSASATFPASAFAAWCATDAACAAAGSLGLTLLHHTDASPFTSATLNWPNVFSGAGVSALQLVSGAVELQPSNFTAKLDQLICSTASPCTAQLSVPLTSAADPSMSFVCLRLEPSIAGSSYQAYGYPQGSDGTAISGIIVNGALRCNTTKFGKHIIMQYKQTPVVSPPPPGVAPPSPPPSPPLLNATGAKYTSDVSLQMTLVAGLSFDSLKSNPALLAALTSSLESSLSAALGGLVPAMLLLSALTNSTGVVRKISRYSASPQSAVTIEFRLVVPAGATEAQIAALQRLISTNTTALFTGSPYTAYFMGSASVVVLAPSSDNSLSDGAVIALTVACLLGATLLAGAAYAMHRWRAYAAILPEKPGGEYDKYGEALVRPDKAMKGRRRFTDRVAPEPVAAAAVVAVDGPYTQQPNPQRAQSLGDGVVPPPWNGANGPVSAVRGGAAGGPGGVAIGENTRVVPYSDDGGGGGGRSFVGAASGNGGGGGGGGAAVKSQADLAFAKMAWS